MSERLNVKLNEMLLKNGTNTFNKVKKDMDKSKKWNGFISLFINKRTIPDGYSCVNFVSNHWNYVFANADKIEIAAIYVLSKAIDQLLERGILIQSGGIYESISQIEEKVSQWRMK